MSEPTSTPLSMETFKIWPWIGALGAMVMLAIFPLTFLAIILAIVLFAITIAASMEFH